MKTLLLLALALSSCQTSSETMLVKHLSKAYQKASKVIPPEREAKSFGIPLARIDYLSRKLGIVFETRLILSAENFVFTSWIKTKDL